MLQLSQFSELYTNRDNSTLNILIFNTICDTIIFAARVRQIPSSQNNTYRVGVVEMTLYELGEEYLDRAARLTDRIHILSKQKTQLEGNRLLELKRRILALYTDASDCRNTARRLMNYYERMSKDEPNNL